MATATRTLPADDLRVLEAAAQRGKTFIRLPEDESWLARIAGIGDVKQRLQRMGRRGSLASLGTDRWVVMPLGASTLTQAAPTKVLLAGLLDGRADWYLGFLSALIDHGLTDIDSDTIYVGVRGKSVRHRLRLGDRTVRPVHIMREDDWSGVERERAGGRVFSYRSDVARTLLDTLDKPRRCGSAEVWVRAWERAKREERVSPHQLIDDSETRSAVLQARLAFWLRETGHVRDCRRVMRMLGGPLGGSQLLDAGQSFGEGDWHRDRDTGLVVNLPERALDGWLSYGK
jgi:predicted transcriptional regulator of viral defense system